MSISKATMENMFKELVEDIQTCDPPNTMNPYNKPIEDPFHKNCFSCGRPLTLVKYGNYHDRYCGKCGVYLPDSIFI